MRRKVLDLFTTKGVLVTEAAGERILDSDNPLDAAQRILDTMPKDVVFLSLDIVVDVLGPAVAPTPQHEPVPTEHSPEEQEDEFVPGEEVSISPSKVEEGKHEDTVLLDMGDLPSVRPTPASSLPSNIVVLEGDTSASSSGNVVGFHNYFKDRFFSIRDLVRRRRGYAAPSKIGQNDSGDPEFKVIGMVKEISRSKFGDVFMELEDETGVMKAVIPRDSPMTAMAFINDEVIGVTCKRTGGRRGYRIEEVVFPEIPLERTPNTADHPVAAMFCSDIHVGSTTFLGGPWKRFLGGLRTGEDLRGWGDIIRYMVIPGDVVDGIGVFPNQEQELVIDDIDKQYDELARLLSPIPDHIEIIIIPGNHDAVRPAEPQPPLPMYIQEKFSDQGVKARFLSNPSYISLDGVEVLAYHGRSMDDIVSSVTGMSYEKPIEAMKLMLQKRHLAPIYGGKTPLAPAERDNMVLDRIPDIFVTGHVHSAGTAVHRGVLLVNASTWQSQTNFQKMHNFNPVPARVPMVNLQTLETATFNFMG